ncbi:MAG: DUF262 domain-containing HNH endonuclease family protein [bacterium]
MEKPFKYFSNLLDIESNLIIYEVPKFQRVYSWKLTNWEYLFEDIVLSNPKEHDYHYLGSFITVQNSIIRAGEEICLEIVDGQQRFITLSLLLMSIYVRLKEIAQLDENIKNNHSHIFRLVSLEKRLFKETNSPEYKHIQVNRNNENKTYCLRLIPSDQNDDLKYYIYLFRKILIGDNIKPLRGFASSQISKCFEYFENRLEKFSYEEIQNFLEKVLALNIVDISAKSLNQAYIMFETLNNRGVPLSAMDIIKNKFLVGLQNNEIPMNDSFKKWKILVNNLGDYSNQDRFLRQFYNAFKYKDNIKLEGYNIATSRKLVDIYLNIITQNSNVLGTIFDDMIDKSKNYNNFINPDDLQNNESINKKLLNLNYIGAATSYTSLMYFFSLEESCFENNAKTQILSDILDFYIKYYVRRNITDFPATRDLDAIQIDLISHCNSKLNKIEKLNSNIIINHLLSSTKWKVTNLRTFEEILSNGMYDRNVGMTRFVLTYLNDQHETREDNNNLWKRNDKNKLIWTIEHVFPKGDNIPVEWVNMIADGDKEKAKDYQFQHVHRLGNLTLSGYNSRLSDQSFDKKQNCEEETILGIKLNLGYKNGLALNDLEFIINDNNEKRSLASADKWSIDYIEGRTKAIVKSLLDIFKFENEP